MEVRHLRLPFPGATVELLAHTLGCATATALLAQSRGTVCIVTVDLCVFAGEVEKRVVPRGEEGGVSLAAMLLAERCLWSFVGH